VRRINLRDGLNQVSEHCSQDRPLSRGAWHYARLANSKRRIVLCSVSGTQLL